MIRPRFVRLALAIAAVGALSLGATRPAFADLAPPPPAEPTPAPNEAAPSEVAPEQAPEAESAADSRATSFQAVEGPTAEQVPGGMLLVAAYAVVLVLLVGYVGRLGALQRKTAAELDRLQSTIERARKA